MAAFSRLLMSLSLAAALLGTAPLASRAEEPPVLKTMLDDVALATKVRPTYQSVTEDPDGTITVKGLQYTIDSKALEAQADMPQFNMEYDIESLTLQGVSEVPGKGYQVAHADYAGLTFKLNGQMLVAIPETTLGNLYVHSVPDNPTSLQQTFASSALAEETDIPQIVVVFGGKSLTIEKCHSRFEGDPWAYRGTQHLSIGRLVVPQDILAMAGDNVPLKQLGYTSLEFSSDSTFKIDITPDNLSFAFDMGLTGKDMGTLRISADIADVPFALIEAARQGKEKTDPDKLIALADGITVSNLSVGFSDASLTNRLIDFFSASQKMDRAQVIATAAASIQLGLVNLKNQDFTNKVIVAVNTFLATPGSLRIIAATVPVKIQQFMQTNGDPGALMKLLQVDVQANQ